MLVINNGYSSLYIIMCNNPSVSNTSYHFQDIYLGIITDRQVPSPWD